MLAHCFFVFIRVQGGGRPCLQGVSTSLRPPEPLAWPSENTEKSPARGLSLLTELWPGILPRSTDVLEGLVRQDGTRDTCPGSSLQTSNGWLELEKWLPVFVLFWRWGSCYVVQNGFELLNSATVIGETIGGHYSTTPGLKWFHCRQVKQMVVYPHNGIFLGCVKG